MQAIQVASYGGPEVLHLQTIDIPTPNADEIVVRLKAAGINPVETYKRSGNYAKHLLPSLPFTPGSEGAGIVYSLGENVKNWEVGQRVYITSSRTGTYAQYAVAKASDVYPLPDDVEFEQGAAVPIAYRTGYRALIQKAKAKEGDWVMVHGASGGVGLAVVQLALSYNMKVIGTAGTDEGMKIIQEQGAFAVNHRKEGYTEEAMDLTPNKQGFNVIIEMLANKNLDVDMDLIARNGVIAVVGNRGEININPRKLMLKESSVVGVLGGTPEEHGQAFAAINQGLQNGTLKPVVGLKFELENVQDAHIEVIEHKIPTQGKIVLSIP